MQHINIVDVKSNKKIHYSGFSNDFLILNTLRLKFLCCLFLISIGPNWKWGDQDGGEGNIGAVYRLKTPTEVYVRKIIMFKK